MNNSFDFEIKNVCDNSTEANIFIHGYSAWQSKDDRKKLIECIPESEFLCGYTNIFAFWDSSHFSVFNEDSILRMISSAPLHWAVRLGSLVVDRREHFLRIREKAENIGTGLLTELGEYLETIPSSIDTINLIGHSLGGRLVVSSLINRAGELPLKINNVLLMAAAVEVGAKESEKMKQIIRGSLFNAYSKKDLILPLNFGEKSVGKNTFELFDNVEMSGFGHTDYWPKLDDVLDKTFFKNKQELIVHAQNNNTDYSEEIFWEKLKNFAVKAGGEVVEKALQLYYAAREPGVSAATKASIYSALGYFIMPLDVIPDVTPVLGFSDDLGVLMAVVGVVSNYINEEVRQKSTQKMSEWIG